ncbi:MAG: PIN domain-containing protein [Actinobacteria bacterium]|nr:PIN domain-containing protein [Actinomycetota bacterium]
MTAFLADGNVLVALTVTDHVHHAAAGDWFEQANPTLATCPITEGTLLRFLLRAGVITVDAIAVLDALRAQPWHTFWPDQLPYRREQLRGVIGHRQVTDAYLVALARHNDGAVVTLDKGLAAMHGPDVLLLQP